MKSIKSIDKQVLQNLNLGISQSKNLMEVLAIDFDLLLKSCNIKASKIQAQGIVSKMKEASIYIKNWQDFQNHKSDSIRGIATFAIANNKYLSFLQKLNSMKIFAKDEHFSVREWAWLALREEVIKNLDEAISLLTKFSLDENENLRRFTSELTRPRGVWCAHIKELKENPQKAIAILENLKADSSKYVQNSVGNWLNDASKSNAIWVKNLTKDWLKNSKNPETKYIVKRGLRNLNKN